MGGSASKPKNSSDSQRAQKENNPQQQVVEQSVELVKYIEAVDRHPNGVAEGLVHLKSVFAQENTRKSVVDQLSASSTLVSQLFSVCKKSLGVESFPQPGGHALEIVSFTVGILPPITEAAEAIGDVLPLLVLVFSDVAESDTSVLCRVQSVLLQIYDRQPILKNAVRSLILGELKAYSNAMRSNDHFKVAAWLRLLCPILEGLRAPLLRKHHSLLSDLVVLARNEKGQVGGEQTPVEIYADGLCRAIQILLSKIEPEDASAALVQLFKTLLSFYNPLRPLVSVGMIVATVRLVDELDGESFAVVHQKLIAVCGAACSSDHKVLALQALQVWQRPGMIALAKQWEERVIEIMAPAFGRQGHIHWDGDVVIAILEAHKMIAFLSDTSAKRLKDAMIAHFRGNVERYEAYFCEMMEKRESIEKQRAELAEEKKQRQSHDVKMQMAATKSKTMQFVYGKVLGSGAYATIKYAKGIEPGIVPSLWPEFAIKAISKKLIAEQQCEEAVQREIQIQKALRDEDGVLKLYHMFEDDKKMHLILDFCPNGDLFDAVLADPTSRVFAQNPKWLKFVLLEVADTLHRIHRNGFYYGDLKPENILLTSSGHVALGDFGGAMTLSEANTAKHFSGTLDYMAPEILSKLCCDSEDDCLSRSIEAEAADWWAFGCVCVQLLTGKLPFQLEGVFVSQAEQLKGFVEFYSDPNNVVSSLEENRKILPEVVFQLLDTKPSTRAKYEQVRSNPFFEGLVPFDFSSSVPPPPVKLAVSASVVSRHSGRKESMMWRNANIAAATQSLASLSISTNLQLEEEKEGVLQLSVESSATLLPRKMGNEPDDLFQYATTMP